MGKKIAAGAQFIQTQYCFDLPLLELFMSRVRDLGLDRQCFILVGVGPDGHVLSVFPGSPLLGSRDWVTAVPPPEHVEPRIAIHVGHGHARAMVVVGGLVGLGRVDHRLSDRTNLFFRYSHSPATTELTSNPYNQSPTTLDGRGNARITVDLEREVVVRPNGEEIPFKIDPFRRHLLLNGLDDIGQTMQHAKKIDGYEAAQKTSQPWMPATNA